MSAETRQRFVLDTNVIVSALAFPGSTPRRAFDVAHVHGVLLASADTTAELIRTLRRPKLAAYITPGEREAFLGAFSDAVDLVEITERVSICRDPHDDKFLELALAGRADYIITGDHDLLALRNFRGTEIVTPATFVDRIDG